MAIFQSNSFYKMSLCIFNIVDLFSDKINNPTYKYKYESKSKQEIIYG